MYRTAFKCSPAESVQVAIRLYVTEFLVAHVPHPQR
jgi:hypothetical protein